MSKYLIAGLGNIGPEYLDTRHNIGFKVVEELALRQGASFSIDRHAFITEIKTKGKSLILIKPTTFMNLSGKAIKHWLSQEKIPLEHLLVITDDIAIPFGSLRLKKQGSSGGHNGLKSIEEHLGSNQYHRQRFGVGSHFAKGKQVEYVLGNFNPDEQITLPETIVKAADQALCFALEGADQAMNKYNS
jgi:PTH1 family peptidyl-tRNA hydrolase